VWALVSLRQVCGSWSQNALPLTEIVIVDGGVGQNLVEPPLEDIKYVLKVRRIPLLSTHSTPGPPWSSRWDETISRRQPCVAVLPLSKCMAHSCRARRLICRSCSFAGNLSTSSFSASPNPRSRSSISVSSARAKHSAISLLES
jgi:hypothetical protein